MTNGTTYYYVVNAINSAGTSANSPEDSATPISPMVNVAFGGTASSSVIGDPVLGGTRPSLRPQLRLKMVNGNAANPGPTGWLRYDFGAGNAQTVKRYTVVSADVANRDPKTWTFQGSNDGSTWTTLDTQSNQAFANRSHANSLQHRQHRPPTATTRSMSPPTTAAARWRSPNSASSPTKAARSRTAPTASSIVTNPALTFAPNTFP